MEAFILIGKIVILGLVIAILIVLKTKYGLAEKLRLVVRGLKKS